MFFIVAGGSPALTFLSLSLSLCSVFLSHQGAVKLPFWLQHISTWVQERELFETVLIGLGVGLMCAHGALAVMSAVRRYAGERRATYRKETHASELHALVHALPLESWLCQQSRSSASVKELRERLQRRHLSLAGLVERCDLAQMLDDAPHETLCSICYEDYADGDPLRLLPCQHYFHVECVPPPPSAACVPRHRSCRMCEPCTVAFRF
jgi:hypothetical protein